MAYPVSFNVTPPEEFDKAQVALRVVIVIVLSILQIGNIVFGGAFGDEIVVGDGMNTVFGDEGRAVFTNDILTLAESVVVDVNDVPVVTYNVNGDPIEVGTPFQTGGVDTITGGSGADNIIGGQAGDTIHAGAGLNIVLGDSGQFVYDATGKLTLAQTILSGD